MKGLAPYPKPISKAGGINWSFEYFRTEEEAKLAARHRKAEGRRAEVWRPPHSELWQMRYHLG